MRQSSIKKGEKSTLNIDRVFITYQGSYIDFEQVKRKRTKSGKPKYNAKINGKKWTKKAKIDSTIGNMTIELKNARELSITVAEHDLTVSFLYLFRHYEYFPF